MVDVPRRMTLSQLIELMLPRCGAVTLRNPFGVIELRGEDLYLRRGRTLSLYHRDAEIGEARSHAHLYLGGLSWARVVEKEGITPRLCFWEDSSETGEKPPLAIAFPRFYDWSRVPIPRPPHSGSPDLAPPRRPMLLVLGLRCPLAGNLVAFPASCPSSAASRSAAAPAAGLPSLAMPRTTSM